MGRNNDASKTSATAIDDFFAAEATKADDGPAPGEMISPESPIGDYTRELQQEYEEQQEEGKL